MNPDADTVEERWEAELASDTAPAAAETDGEIRDPATTKETPISYRLGAGLGGESETWIAIRFEGVVEYWRAPVAGIGVRAHGGYNGNILGGSFHRAFPNRLTSDPDDIHRGYTISGIEPYAMAATDGSVRFVGQVGLGAAVVSWAKFCSRSTGTCWDGGLLPVPTGSIALGVASRHAGTTVVVRGETIFKRGGAVFLDVQLGLPAISGRHPTTAYRPP